MKKALFILGAVLAVCACSKVETVVNEEANEISVNAVAGVQTKGAELVGTAFPDDCSIFVGASIVGGTAEQKVFLDNVEFAKSGDVWKGKDASKYWPLGGKYVDFLAYALPTKDAEGNALKVTGTAPTVTFDSAAPANKFTTSSWDTYANQYDLLYAKANGYKNQAAAVPLEFNHALALIVVNVRFNTGGGEFKITDVSFGQKYTTGVLEVNNERNNLAVNWTTSTEANLAIKATAAATAKTKVANLPNTVEGCVKYGDNLNTTALKGKFNQLGETLLVIPQAGSNPTITFELGGTEYVYEVNAKRLNWEAGKAYIYDFSFNNNEITFAPTVVDWVVVDPS